MNQYEPIFIFVYAWYTRIILALTVPASHMSSAEMEWPKEETTEKMIWQTLFQVKHRF